MKTCIGRLLSVLVLLALPTVVMAQFAYVTNNGAIAITGYSGPGGTVTIPSSINSLLVTGIGDYAFEDFIGLTGVVLPNSVTSIGDHAFENCIDLTGITIPNSVTTI